MSRLRVLIADDHEEIRRMVTRLLSSKFEIAGSVADGQELIDSATELHPDVIVSDIHMPLTTGLQAMRELRSMGLDIPFVLISASLADAAEYIDEGATGFVDKIDIGFELVAAVRAASNGQAYFSRGVSPSVCDSVQ